MGDLSKAFLYAWASKKKLMPDYKFIEFGANQKKRFKCEVCLHLILASSFIITHTYHSVQLRVGGYSYVGLGNSTSKKDSSNNAAKDFLLFLVREGELTANELPFNTMANPLAGGNAPPFVPQYPIHSPSNTFGASVHPIPPPPIPPQPQVKPPLSKGFMAVPDGPKQEYIDRIAQKRKFEEADELDINSGIHGNWTFDNAKQELNHFFQKNKIKAEYQYTAVGPDHNRYDISH